jgi:hypothetical protein
VEVGPLTITDAFFDNLGVQLAWHWKPLVFFKSFGSKSIF